jgi:hypothetical protein
MKDGFFWGTGSAHHLLCTTVALCFFARLMLKQFCLEQKESSSWRRTPLYMPVAGPSSVLLPRVVWLSVFLFPFVVVLSSLISCCASCCISFAATSLLAIISF